MTDHTILVVGYYATLLTLPLLTLLDEWHGGAAGSVLPHNSWVFGSFLCLG